VLFRSLADVDAGALADVDADALAVMFGLAAWLAAVAGLLAQSVPVSSAAGFWLELAASVAVAVAVAVAAGLLLALAPVVPLAFAVGLPLPLTGMVGEPDGVADGLVAGVAAGDGVLAGFSELASGFAAAEAEAGEHVANGVGSSRPAGVVPTAAVPLPLPSGLPPPADADVGAPAAWWPSRTLDQEALMAWRSGGTEASTTPTANTAQPSAMAGLSSSSRQSPACRDACRA
jgi:hypothetical protein